MRTLRRPRPPASQPTRVLPAPEDQLVTVPYGDRIFHLRRPGSARSPRCSLEANGMLIPLLTASRSASLVPCPACFHSPNPGL